MVLFDIPPKRAFVAVTKRYDTMQVVLRPLRRDDAVHLRRWSQCDETARLLGARVTGLSQAEAEAETSRIIAANGTAHQAFMIEVDGQTVGNCWLGHLTDKSASLGIVIGERSYRGVGVGTEAMRQLLAVAGGREVTLWVLASNERALRTYRRMGFRETGRQIRDVPRSGPVETVNMKWTR